MKIKNLVEKSLFGSKWILVPFYFGLVIAQLVYLYWFCGDVWHMVSTANSVSEEDGMLIILGLVDIVMVSNLLKMVISGSYTSFITKDHSETAEKASSGLLKVKMASSLVGVSSIHLLQSFINSEKISWDTINKQMWIHVMFLVGALVLMIIEYIHVKCEKIEHDIHEPKHQKQMPRPNYFKNNSAKSDKPAGKPSTKPGTENSSH